MLCIRPDHARTNMSGCIALIVAAGRGERVGGDLPKQFRRVAGKPLVRYSVERFIQHPAIDAVRVVIHPDDQELYRASVAGLDTLPPVFGGATRQDSVRLGLESLAELSPDRVLIHDAARPFVDANTIARTIAALDDRPGAIAAVPVSDTLKRGEAGEIRATLDRDELWRAQTPQGFRYREIMSAHKAAEGAALTDDAAVAEREGLHVSLVMGSEDNFKVTSEADMARAARLLEASPMETRTGLGFDVHRFGPGDRVWLCGVPVPHDFALTGHSDADVGLHALTDAILGAIGAGDIGAHFPSSDDQWRGASSDMFLRRAGEMVATRGGRILNLDVTLVCQGPRIGPYHEDMIGRIAEILAIARERVSVKATTTDKLGFTGRGEGIAAQAVATICLDRHSPDR